MNDVPQNTKLALLDPLFTRPWRFFPWSLHGWFFLIIQVSNLRNHFLSKILLEVASQSLYCTGTTVLFSSMPWSLPVIFINLLFSFMCPIPLQCKLCKLSTGTLVYPSCLKKYLTHLRHSTYICWMNEPENEWMSDNASALLELFSLAGSLGSSFSSGIFCKSLLPPRTRKYVKFLSFGNKTIYFHATFTRIFCI